MVAIYFFLIVCLKYFMTCFKVGRKEERSKKGLLKLSNSLLNYQPLAGVETPECTIHVYADEPDDRYSAQRHAESLPVRELLGKQAKTTSPFRHSNRPHPLWNHETALTVPWE